MFFACVRVCAFFDLVTFRTLVPGPGVETFFDFLDVRSTVNSERRL